MRSSNSKAPTGSRLQHMKGLMPGLLGVLSLWLLISLTGCGDSKAHVPADAPGYVKGKAVHPTIKIGKPYRVMGKKYYPEYEPDYDETGIASWYGPNFHGKMTANGEKYNQWAMTAAHTTLPMPSMVRVTDLKTDKSIVVRINDRGPFSDGRIIDLSRAAAEALGTRARGLAKVRVEYLPEETDAYIAKLQLKKPSSWQQVDVAKAKIEQTLKESHEVVQAPEPPTQPIRQANNVPSSFAYEGALPDATTIDVRGVKMEEFGYAHDAFSVLDEADYGAPEKNRVPKHAVPALRPSVSPHEIRSGKQLFVQVGTYADKANAERIAQQLSPLGAANISPVPAGEATFWRLMLGPVFNRGIAEAVREKLSAMAIYDAEIIEQ